MTYWKYRAYDELLAITEGIIIGPDGDPEIVMQTLVLQLRQRGLQGIDLILSNHSEYANEQRLEKMKNRLNPSQPPKANETRLSILERLKLIWAAICGRTNT